METTATQARQEGFRLRVPATSLWFNVDAQGWSRVCAALEAVGAETATAGLAGEQLCGAGALQVTYRAQEQRMQAELSAEGGAEAASALAALKAMAEAPAAEASPMWLWSPVPFGVGGQEAQPAIRVVRAARWVLPRGHAVVALAAAAAAEAGLGAGAALRLEIQSHCEVEVSVPPPGEAAPKPDLDRQARAFGALLQTLGEPGWAVYATQAA